MGKIVYVHADGESVSEEPVASLERYNDKSKEAQKDQEDLETEAFTRSLQGEQKKTEVTQEEGKEFELGVEFMRLLPDAREQYDAFIQRLEEKNIPFKILAED